MIRSRLLTSAFLITTATAGLLGPAYGESVGSSATSALSPYEIMRREDTLEAGRTLSTTTTMVLIDAQGRQRVRELRNYRLGENGKDTRTLVLFLSPPDVRNTGYLNYSWQESDKEDDSWLYLPALRKVKRIAGGDKSNAFMGSDFNYSDLNGTKLDDWTYSLLKESETIEGHDCWLVEATPKPELLQKVLKETGYVRRHVWIRKDNFVAVRGLYWLERGGRQKRLSVNELQQVDGIWTAKEIKMEMLKAGNVEHASILKLGDVTYNVPLEEEFFTTRTMERGL
jgi:hypothetical protein